MQLCNSNDFRTRKEWWLALRKASPTLGLHFIYKFCFWKRRSWALESKEPVFKSLFCHFSGVHLDCFRILLPYLQKRKLYLPLIAIHIGQTR